MKRLFLNPNDSERLMQSYRSAVTGAVELMVATAFLTEWPITTPLNKKCASLLVLVGTDFGLTRKKALRELLKWTPPEKKGNILAVPAAAEGAFHPKIIAWKEQDGGCYVLVGSSNLTSAGFQGNYEANLFQEISGAELATIRSWLRHLAENSQVISSDWIRQYKEAQRKGGGGVRRSGLLKKKHVIDLSIRVLRKHQAMLSERRRKQESFKEIRRSLINQMKRSAEGNLPNEKFWQAFWELWGAHRSRFQGSGIQFKGKAANWREACASLLRVINGPSGSFDRDEVVRREIDFLKSRGNPVRGAWLSEMLCHLYPRMYPVHNKPVKKWLK